MNETIRNLMERRSIRTYKAEQIKPSELSAILEAGKYAATAGGKQSPVLVVAQNPETVKRLSKLNAAFTGNPDGDPFYGAPTVVVVFADSRVKQYVEDGALAIGNMMNAAHSLDVDSCWIHRAKEAFETDEGRALKREWGLSDDYVGVGNCVLGYRNCEYPQAQPRKDDYVIFAK